MSMSLISRRQFLTLPLALLVVPIAARAVAQGPSLAQGQIVKGTYAAEIGILYDMLTLRLQGSIEETVDRSRGEYRVLAMGTGPGIANRFESNGVLRNERWAPVRSESWFDIRGRQTRTEVAYDWRKRQVQYRARGETFFLKRLRVVDDLLSLAEGTHVDDIMSATLNYADGRWRPDVDGAHRTLVVRRRRTENEGPDDVATSYRAEVVPLNLKMAPDTSGKATAIFDLSPFSSWAKPSHPARIVFAHTRRPELITTSMILGTSVTIRFTDS
jgi:hypothetical protein